MTGRVLPIECQPVKARVLNTWLAVLNGAQTVEAVGKALGLGKSATHRWLVEARRAGLVYWVPGKMGTLHARYGAVKDYRR